MPRPKRVAVMLDLQWPFKRHAGVLTGILQYVQEHNWEITVDEYADDSLSRSSKEAIPYDGIIARASKKLLIHAQRMSVPIVNVWYSSPVRKHLPGVFPDFSSIGVMQAEHLLARGFRKFSGLIYDGDLGSDMEMNAFSKTIQEAGLLCSSASIPVDASRSLLEWRRAQRTITSWMDSWELPIGVVVGNEQDGRVVAQLCRQRGWRVPEQVAIIAGHNEETICEHLRPTLTSVEVGYENVGIESARLLQHLMNGEAEPKEPVLIPAKELVVRESTDFFAVEDPLIAKALQFISSKSHQDIDPDDVSSAVATGTRTLQRRFDKYLGRSIAAEIRRVRIERAKRELTQTEKTLKEISQAVGFGHPMRMYEVFRRELKMTPSQYRQERLANAAMKKS